MNFSLKLRNSLLRFLFEIFEKLSMITVRNFLTYLTIALERFYYKDLILPMPPENQAFPGSIFRKKLMRESIEFLVLKSYNFQRKKFTTFDLLMRPF